MRTILYLLTQFLKYVGMPVALILTGFYCAFRFGMLFGYPAWILAAVWVAFPLAGWLASPWAGLFSPGGKYDKPQPAYSIPESLRMKNRLPEAFEAYRDLSRKFPKEVRPWVEMIRIAHVDLKDDDLARHVLSSGRSHFRKAEKREELERIAKAILTIPREKPTAENRLKIDYPVQKPALKEHARVPEVPVPNLQSHQKSVPKASATEDWWGASVKALEGKEVSAFGVNQEDGGIQLVDVPVWSKAARMGLLEGDVIQQVDERPTKSVKALRKESSAPHGSTLRLTVMRAQQTQSLEITPASE